MIVDAAAQPVGSPTAGDDCPQVEPVDNQTVCDHPQLAVGGVQVDAVASCRP